MRLGERMDKTDAINVTFIIAVIVILVASFIYINFFEEDDEEEEEEDSEVFVDIGVEEIDTSEADVPAYIADSAAPAAAAVAAAPVAVPGLC